MAKTKVISAAVLATPPRNERKCWVDHLPPDQQAECRKAREQIRKSGAALRPIARQWVEELGLNVSAQTVNDWLRSHDG